jgi:hypothetical protein
MSVFNWFGQMWQSLRAAADLSDGNSATDDPSFSDPCHLFQDALDEELRLMDLQNERIGNLLDQFWNCRKQSGAGLSTDEFQRQNVTQQSVNGAKLLLTTAANRVRQVVEEIEIVTRQDSQ